MTRTLTRLSQVAACGLQPCSAADFGAHTRDTAQVVAACAKRAPRGRECETARQAAIRAKATMELFRRGFA